MITADTNRAYACPLCVAVLLLFTALFFGGCARETEIPLPSFSPLLSETDPVDSDVLPFAREFCLILPADSSDQMVERTRELGEAIRARTGIGWRILTDDYLVVPESDIFEVVLGWADHPQRRTYASDLRREDYLCAVNARTMVLCGRTEATTLAAMEQFQTAVLPYADLALLDGEIFYHTGTYEKQEVTLNGISLGQWQIVCASEEEWLIERGEELRNILSEQSGYELPLLRAGEYHGTAPYLLLQIGGEDATQAGITQSKEGVVLSAADSFGMKRATEYVTELILRDEDKDGICHSAITENLLLSVTGNEFRLSGLFGGFFDDPKEPEEISRISGSLIEDRTDAVFAWNLSERVKEYLSELFFSYSPVEREDGFFGIRPDSEVTEKDGLCSDSAWFAAWVGEKEKGFWWVVCETDARLPSEITESSAPVLLLLYDEEGGDAEAPSEILLNELFSERVTGKDATATLKGYASESLRVTWTLEKTCVGVLSFTVERLR